MVLVCTTLAFFTALEHALASTNLARPVDHWGKPPARYSYINPQAWRNVSIPLVLGEDVTERRSQCEPPLPYAELSAKYPDNRTIVPCDSGWEYDTGDSHLHSIMDEWNLVCKRGWMVSALAAAYMAGGVVGSALAGIAADRVGRRPVLGILLALLVSAGTALAFANSGPLLTTLCFLLSACAAGVLVASHDLLFDVTATQHRVLYCAVAAAAFVATVYTEVVHVLIRNWHAAQVAYMVPSCGMMATAYVVEESPCWLLAFSEMRCVENARSRAASSHRVEPHLFRHHLSALWVEMSRQHEQLAAHQEQEGPNSIISNRGNHSVSFHMGNKETFSHLSVGHVLRYNDRARSALVVMQLPCVVADDYALTRAGRRLSSTASMLAIFIATGALSAVNVLGAPDQLDVIVAVSGLQVQDISAIAAFAFSAELYPIVLRESAFGYCYKSGSISAFAASFVNAVRSPPLRVVFTPRRPPCYSSSL
ncbi:solute carrier family 22 member 12-like [Rhipicephalus microplus]|uniref:solute carrier family 22 member 12-like n=1 Tax=Rhipicephalus microplus TaxID=6941 RepID=UPI003F6CD901